MLFKLVKTAGDRRGYVTWPAPGRLALTGAKSGNGVHIERADEAEMTDTA